jgi:uncharacterized membrane protein
MPQVGSGEILLMIAYVVVTAGVFLALVAGAFVGTRWLARVMFGRSRRLETEEALRVLRDRRSRGEITEDEFEQARRALGA